MEFIPNIKSKKTKVQSIFTAPYPELTDKKIIGYFNGYSVDVINHNDMINLYNNGYYGKGSESRSAPSIVIPRSHSSKFTIKQNESLILDLEESFFLNYIDVLEIQNLFNGSIIERSKLLEIFLEIKNNFFETFIAFLYLKSKNWVIKTGFKFGGEFLIYKNGMHLYHASFIVLIESNVSMASKDIQGTQRIAETSNKDVLILEIYYPDNFVKSQFLERLNEFTVSELIIKRFRFTDVVNRK